MIISHIQCLSQTRPTAAVQLKAFEVCSQYNEKTSSDVSANQVNIAPYSFIYVKDRILKTIYSFEPQGGVISNPSRK